MEVFITLIFIGILLTLVYIAYKMKEIEHDLTIKKMPFLKDDKWTNDIWFKKVTAKKQGRPLGSKNKPKVNNKKARA